MNLKKFTAAVSTLALMMTSVLTFGVTATIAATTFTDADEISSWAVDSVEALADSDVLSGRPDGSFDPKGQLNRAEMAKVAVKAADLSEDTTGAPHFSDVASSDWYYAFVETLYNNGVVGGINGGALDEDGLATYNPAGTLNRAEGAKILVDAFDLETSYAGTPPNFSDVSTDAWYFDYVETAYAHGLLNGYEDGDFGPGDAITREQVAVIAQNSVEEADDGSKRRDTYTAGAASSYEPEEDDTPPPPVVDLSDGTLNVSVSASSPDGATLPDAANVTVAAWDFTASSDGDVTLTSLVVNHGGIGARAQVTAQVLKDADGNRVSKSKSSPNSDDETTFTLLSGGLTIAAGTTETIKLIVTTGSVGEHNFSLVSADVVNSNAQSVTGSFPLTSQTMTFSTTAAGVLTMGDDGSPANVRVGEAGVKIAKFKLENANVEDINLTAVTLKETGTASEASAISNIQLMQGTTLVAEGTLSDKYISFQFDTPFLIEKNKTEKFSVVADIIGEAGKTLIIDLNNIIDIEAEGLTYGFGAGVTDSFAPDTVNIEAGAISVVKVDPIDKIRRNKTDVVLATVDVTVNSGSNVEMKAFNANVAITDTNTTDGDTTSENHTYNADDMLENIELYDVATGTVYDLTASGATTQAATYYDQDLDIAFTQGEARSFQLRADTKSSTLLLNSGGTETSGVTNFEGKTVTVSFSGIGDSTTTTGIDFQETADDTYVTDVTPSSLSFKTMSGTASSATLTVINQSSSKNAVVGAEKVEGLIFEVEAGTISDLLFDEVKVKGTVVDYAATVPTHTVATPTPNDTADAATATIDTDIVITADTAGAAGNSLTITVTAEDSAVLGDSEGVTITKSGNAITAAIHNETTGSAVVDVTRAGLVACLNTATTAVLTDASYTTGTDTDGTITCTVTDDVTSFITAAGTTATKAIAVTVTTLAGGDDADAQISTATPANVAIGDVFTITIDSTDYDFTATAATVKNVVDGLSPLANANTAVTCSDDDLKVTCTAASAGTAFTVAATVVSANSADVADNTRVSMMSLYEGSTLLDTVSGTQISSTGVATFDGFESTITKNQSNRYTVEVNYVDDEDQAQDTLNLEITSLSLEDDDSDDLTSATCSGTCTTISAITGMASPRTVTIIGTGALTIAVDNTDTETNRAAYVLGNDTSEFVASYEFTATNEAVKIKDFTVTQVTASTDMDDGISELIVYADDKTTEIARKSVTANAVTFTDISDFVIALGSENVYIKVIAHKMGLDEAGAVIADMTLTFKATDVEGDESGNSISTGVGIASATSPSLAFTTIPTRISAVDLVDSYGGVSVATVLTNGVNNLAILKLTTDASTNTDADTGGSLKTLLTGITFDINANAGIAADTVTVEKIGGTGDYTFAAENVAVLADTESTTTVTVTMGSVATVNKEIDNSETSYYVIKASATGLDSDSKLFAQVKFTDLDGGDIDYSSNDTDGLESSATDRAALYLGTTKLDGPKISQ